MPDAFPSIPLAGTLLRPLDRALTRGLNESSPDVTPSESSLINAYYRGWISETELQESLLWLGIDVSNHNGVFNASRGIRKAWQEVVHSMRPVPGANFLLASYAQASMPAADLDKLLHHAGLSTRSQRRLWRDFADLPPLGLLIEQFRMGRIAPQKFADAAALHGSADNTWLKERLAFSNPFSPDLAWRMYYSGLLKEEDAIKHTAASGYPDAEQTRLLNIMAFSRLLPDRSELIRQHRLGSINRADFDEWMKWLGYADEQLRRVTTHATATLPYGMVLDLWNRELLDPERARQHLLAGGFVHDQDRGAIERLRHVQIQPSELTLQLLRAKFAIRFQELVQGRPQAPEEVRRAAERTGRAEKNIHLEDVDDVHADVSQSQIEWLSHWNRPSGSDALVARFRLTPVRCAQFKRMGLDVDPLPEEAIDQLIEANGVAPKFIPYAKALTYEPIPLRMLHMAYAGGKMSHAELVIRLQANGMLAEDAETVATGWDAAIEQAKLKPIEQFVHKQILGAIKQVEQGYSAGYLNPANALAQLVGFGVPQPAAQMALTTVDVDRLHERMVKGINTIRDDFDHGAINAQHAADMLFAIGITQPRAAEYVQEWAMEHKLPVKTANTAKVLDWLKNGSIAPTDARNRLVNLGWSEPDAAIQVKLAENAVQKLHARQLLAKEKTAQAAARLLQKAHEELIVQQKQIQNAIRKATSPAVLQRWFRKGIIGAKFFFERLAAMGISAEEARALLNDAILKIPEGKDPENVPPWETENAGTTPVDLPENP